MAEIRPELQARFGNDPDALEWARGHVQRQIEWLNEAAALPQASAGFVHIAKWCAEFMHDTLIGNRLGYGAFDERYAPEQVRGPRVLNTYTAKWVPVAREDLDEFRDDPKGFAERAQERFRADWDARERKDDDD